MKHVRLHDIDDRRNGSGAPGGSGGPSGSGGSDVEAQLRDLTCDLAGDVVAPPFDEVRHAIGRRSRALRRRRHVRRVATGGIVAVAAAVAAVTLQPVRPDVQVDTAGDGSGTDTTAALTLDLAGWTLERAEEHDDIVDMLGTGTGADPASVVQLFRVRGRLDGPLVYLEHSFATDTIVPVSGDDQVDIGGAAGYVMVANGIVNLRWNPSSTDSEAQLTAFGLDEDEVIDFARSLDPIEAVEESHLAVADDVEDAENANDAATETATGSAGTEQLGFAATTAPRGIEEVGLPPEERSQVNVRRSWFVQEVDAGGTIEIQVDNRGERAFETTLYDPDRFTVWGAPEQVTVLGRRAVLQHDPAGDRWILQWRHAEDTWVTVTIEPGSVGPSTLDDAAVAAASEAVGRDTVDQVVAHLQELPEAGWRAALASTTAG